MKRIILTLILSLFLFSTNYAQVLIGNDYGTSRWVHLGSISLPQGGNDFLLRIVGGAGYNASPSQQARIEMHMRTSNSSSLDANGFGFSAIATSFEMSTTATQLKIVPNAAGASATAYGIYALLYSYPGGSYFTIEAPAGTWTSVLTSSTTDPGGYVVPFQHNINSDTFIAGNVGIGTNTADAKLAVKGTIHAQEIKVDMVGWADYVFKTTYRLPSLGEIKTYIDKNQHLPDMPSEQEVAKNGVNLGEMIKLQTKKIEELTLYLIDKDKQLSDQQKQIEKLKKDQETRIAVLEKLLSKLTDK